MGTTTDARKVLTSGKIMGNKQNRQEWMVRGRNKYKKDRYEHIEGEINYQDENSFELLREEDHQENQSKEGEKAKKNKKETTKEWVNKIFSKVDEKENQSEKNHQEEQVSEKLQ